MKLHGARFSPYFERVHLTLTLKGALDEVEFVGMPMGGLAGEEYRRLHPGGKIPCLELPDGTGLPESQVICDYLERRFPTPALRPTDRLGKAQVDLICRLVDTTLFPGLRPLMVEAPRREDAAIARQAISVVDHFIAPGPFAVGDTWSLADCALIPALYYVDRLSGRLGETLLLTHSKLHTYSTWIDTTEPVLESRRAMGFALGDAA